jgi:hypothetical protein
LGVEAGRLTGDLEKPPFCYFVSVTSLARIPLHATFNCVSQPPSPQTHPHLLPGRRRSKEAAIQTDRKPYAAPPIRPQAQPPPRKKKCANPDRTPPHPPRAPPMQQHPCFHASTRPSARRSVAHPCRGGYRHAMETHAGHHDSKQTTDAHNITKRHRPILRPALPQALKPQYHAIPTTCRMTHHLTLARILSRDCIPASACFVRCDPTAQLPLRKIQLWVPTSASPNPHSPTVRPAAEQGGSGPDVQNPYATQQIRPLLKC